MIEYKNLNNIKNNYVKRDCERGIIMKKVLIVLLIGTSVLFGGCNESKEIKENLIGKSSDKGVNLNEDEKVIRNIIENHMKISGDKEQFGDYIKIPIEFENPSDKEIATLMVDVAFFKDNKEVQRGTILEYNIKPGAKVTTSLGYNDKEFDRYEVFFGADMFESKPLKK